MGNSCGLPSRSHRLERSTSFSASEKTCVASVDDSLTIASVDEKPNYKVSSTARCRGCDLHCPHPCARRTDVSDSKGVGTVLPFGLVGIMKEGQISTVSATIQLLYHIRPFRDAVDDLVQPGMDPRTASAARYLKRVFRDLDESTRPVSLGDLTPVLGWDDRVCRTRLSETYEILSLINTISLQLSPSLRGVMSGLFSVTKRSSSHAYSPTYNSRDRLEPSKGMTLDVRGQGDLNAAMMEFLQPTSSYDQKGKLEGLMQTTFESFPDVWVVGLRRFHINGFGRAMKVCRSRFEFEESFDARRYLTNTGPSEREMSKDVDLTYRLCGVLVFERTGWEGKWWLYLRLESEGGDGKQKGDDRWTWWKFDGPTVCEVDSSEAIEGSFGPGLPDLEVGWKEFKHQCGYWEYPKTADALIYVRDSKVDATLGRDHTLLRRKG